MNIAICDDDKGVCSQLEGWIEQYNYENATRLYVDVYHSAETLQQLCDIYEKHGFSRCHKSYLINLNYVSEYSMSKVKMSDGKEIIIGKSRRKQFKDEFINHELMED